NTIELLNSVTDSDLTQILKVWESAVRATHHFLNEETLLSLIPCVVEGVTFITPLVVIRDTHHAIQAFMGVHESKIEMLFIHDDYRGKGLGKQLIQYAVNTLSAQYVDVNEQNPEGVGFYKHMGFEVFDRSACDDQGNPFPILHMKR
ncbi:MAG: GNAT family N-acetyltransferase, partial [Cellulosilyticaceae bacterium]